MISLVHAQEGVELAHSFVAEINRIILFPLITLLLVIALLIFIWGAFQYVSNAGNDAGRAAGKRHLLWGVIGMLIMLSAYAILTIAANTFGIDPDQYRRETFSGTSAAPVTSPAPVTRPGGPSTPTTPAVTVPSSLTSNPYTYAYVEMVENGIPANLAEQYVTDWATYDANDAADFAEAMSVIEGVTSLSRETLERVQTEIANTVSVSTRSIPPHIARDLEGNPYIYAYHEMVDNGIPVGIASYRANQIATDVRFAQSFQEYGYISSETVARIEADAAAQ